MAKALAVLSSSPIIDHSGNDPFTRFVQSNDWLRTLFEQNETKSEQNPKRTLESEDNAPRVSLYAVPLEGSDFEVPSGYGVPLSENITYGSGQSRGKSPRVFEPLPARVPKHGAASIDAMIDLAKSVGALVDAAAHDGAPSSWDESPFESLRVCLAPDALNKSCDEPPERFAALPLVGGRGCVVIALPAAHDSKVDISSSDDEQRDSGFDDTIDDGRTGGRSVLVH